MKVGVIGGGSIGLLCAFYLSKTNEVTIYTRTPEQATEINHHGVHLRKGSVTFTSKVLARPFDEWRGAEALTIIAVKQYQLHTIIEKIQNQQVKPDNLLFLQNGMGHLKLLELLKEYNLYVGTVEHGALRENAHTVSHNGAGLINVGVYKGDSSPLKTFISNVPCEFPIQLKEEYFDMLKNKLIVNAIINPLTALLGVRNGALITNPFFLEVLKDLFHEIAEILNLENQSEYLDQVMKICEKTANNRSSMLKDIEAGRFTEVDAIVGFLIEEAEKKGKKAQQLKQLYFLIKGLEQNERGEHP